MTTATRTRLLALILAGLGLVVLTISATGVFGALGAIGRGDALVANHSIDGTGLSAGIGLLLIFFVVLMPVAPPTKLGALPTIPPAAKPVMVLAAVFIVFSPLAATIDRFAIDATAKAHGYVACSDIPSERKAPDRWARRRVECPTKAPY